ncbi:MAG: hypothetical protein WBS24_08070 [Terriglobales bacterium]
MKSSRALALSRVVGVCFVALLIGSFAAGQKPQKAQRAAAEKTAPPKIALSLDATDAPRKIFHARLTIPASPGTLTLYYPKWIPGEHGPTGPIEDLAGLTFTANGQTLGGVAICSMAGPSMSKSLVAFPPWTRRSISSLLRAKAAACSQAPPLPPTN